MQKKRFGVFTGKYDSIRIKIDYYAMTLREVRKSVNYNYVKSKYTEQLGYN